MKSKLPQVGTTIFTVMSELARKHNAINLSQGFPDFDCPDRLRELTEKHLNDGKNQYPPMAGIIELREQIARKVKNLYNHVADPETEVTVTSGATEALFDAIHASVSHGDEVIVFDPAYDSYAPAIALTGATPIHLKLDAPNFSIDWTRVSHAITNRTKLIIINSPHNPCGTILTVTDLDSLAKIIRDKDILVISDEVYEHMVFDNRKHVSVLSHSELSLKSFAIFSFGKTYHATGWKLAYCIAPKELTREFRKIHQFVTFTSNSFLQYALADFMTECPEHASQLHAFYQKKRDYFCSLLATSKFKLSPSSGTYFQLVDYSEISEAQDTEFADWLTIEAGVAAIPLKPFYEPNNLPHHSHFIRFCFCKDDSTLREASARLCSL